MQNKKPLDQGGIPGTRAERRGPRGGKGRCALGELRQKKQRNIKKTRGQNTS